MATRNPNQTVVVARGTSEEELRRIALILHQARLPFEVEEGVGGNPERPQWRWDLSVPVARLDEARRVLSAEPHRPSSAEPTPAPLFDPHGYELVRVVLMLAAFGLAGGLWFRTCVS